MKKWTTLFIFTVILCLESNSQAIKIDSLGNKIGKLTNYLWERDHDSTYIENYNDRVSVRILALNKYTYFNVFDLDQNHSLLYRPEIGYNLGIGFVNRWFSLDVSLNFDIGEDVIPDARTVDIQGSVFSTKFILEGALKYLDGHQLFSTENVPSPPNEEILIRPDVYVTSLWLQFYYAINYDRFSIKAPFVFNERQIKSAGSWVPGVSFNLYSMRADSSIVPQFYESYFSEDLYLTSLNIINFNLHFGYIYSIAVKRFFTTFGALPGVGVEGGDYRTEFSKPLRAALSPVFRGIFAIGYNEDRWYVGGQMFADFNFFRIVKSNFVITGQTKTKIFIGWRFGGNKKS